MSRKAKAVKKPKTRARNGGNKQIQPRMPQKIELVQPKVPRLRLPASTAAGQSFLACKLGMREGASGARIPTGLACKTATFDYKTSVTVGPSAAGRIIFFEYPMLPGSLVLLEGVIAACPAIGGGTVAVNTSTTATGVAIPFTEYASSAVVSGVSGSTPAKVILNYAGITSARPSHRSFCVTPISQITTNAGRYAVADIDVDWPRSIGAQVFGSATSPPDPSNPLSQMFGHCASAVTQGPWSSLLGESYESVSTYPGSRTGFVGQQFGGFGASGSDFEEMYNVEPATIDTMGGLAQGTVVQMDYSVAEFYQTLSSGGAPPTLSTIIAAFGLQTVGAGLAWTTANNVTFTDATGNFHPPVGDMWRARDCRVKFVVMDQVPAGVNFVIDTRLCLEACLSSTSVFRQMLAPSPPRDIKAIETARKIDQSMAPSAESKSTSGSWVNFLTQGIAGIGQAVGKMGIPYVSPIAAAIGGISSGLNAMMV